MLRGAVDLRAPRLAVLRHLTPPLEGRRDARVLERLVQRVPVRELRPPVRPRVADPRGEELAREPLVAHPGNVPRPAKFPQRDAVVEVLDLQSNNSDF